MEISWHCCPRGSGLLLFVCDVTLFHYRNETSEHLRYLMQCRTSVDDLAQAKLHLKDVTATFLSVRSTMCCWCVCAFMLIAAAADAG